jgi:hypothetical protein
MVRARSLAALIALLLLTGCRQERTVVKSMTWRAAPLGMNFLGVIEPTNAETPTVELEFVGIDCFEFLHQKSLLQRLQVSGRNPVDVEFVLTSNLGGWGRGLAWSSLRKINDVPYAPNGPDYGGCLNGAREPF